MATTTQHQVDEDVWIPTCCGQCYCMCGIKVRRQNGVVTEIAGNPDVEPAGFGQPTHGFQRPIRSQYHHSESATHQIATADVS